MKTVKCVKLSQICSFQQQQKTLPRRDERQEMSKSVGQQQKPRTGGGKGTKGVECVRFRGF